jgi:periplasmic divalent cation tolerance protein
MVVVLCNVPPLQADKIAIALVVEGLAACVNAMPGVTSTYQWEGSMCQEPETALWIKVANEKVAALSARLCELHPAEVPEILVLPVDVGRSEPRYVAWVRGEGR